MDKKNVLIKRADFTDAVALAEICKKSFDQEMILRRDGTPGGPPFYNDPAWHIYSMKEGVYHKIFYQNELVGGIIIAFRGKKDELYHWELVQIYIDPEHWNKGIGSIAIQQIESWFPEMYKLTTGTPSFSTTNIQFYKKLGFKCSGESISDEHLKIILFEKLYSH